MGNGADHLIFLKNYLCSLSIALQFLFRFFLSRKTERQVAIHGSLVMALLSARRLEWVSWELLSLSALTSALNSLSFISLVIVKG